MPTQISYTNMKSLQRLLMYFWKWAVVYLLLSKVSPSHKKYIMYIEHNNSNRDQISRKTLIVK